VGLFAALALLLAAAGIYSVMYYAVAERTREIGVRVAIGAAPADILALILGHAGRLGAIGAACGLVCAGFLTRVNAGLLVGVTWHGPTTYVGVALLLAVVAGVAAAVPAIRATRADPLAALRE